MHKIPDAIREVTARVQRAIHEGFRSRAIDADDLVEVLLAIADELDPPIPTPVSVTEACPDCGERSQDRLIWQDDEFVRCAACGTIFEPGRKED